MSANRLKEKDPPLILYLHLKAHNVEKELDIRCNFSVLENIPQTF
jgi:hypothetical protein